MIEVDLKNAYNASEYANLEDYLSKLPGVKAVHLDRSRGVAHLTYDDGNLCTPVANPLASENWDSLLRTIERRG